jgi:hypothetical protein
VWLRLFLSSPLFSSPQFFLPARLPRLLNLVFLGLEVTIYGIPTISSQI